MNVILTIFFYTCACVLDVDNLGKFVLDSLNKHAYLDDCQIAVLNLAKLYTDLESDARIEVKIRKLKDDEAIFGTVPNSYA